MSMRKPEIREGIDSEWQCLCAGVEQAGWGDTTSFDAMKGTLRQM